MPLFNQVFFFFVFFSRSVFNCMHNCYVINIEEHTCVLQKFNFILGITNNFKVHSIFDAGAGNRVYLQAFVERFVTNILRQCPDTTSPLVHKRSQPILREVKRSGVCRRCCCNSLCHSPGLDSVTF